MATQGTFSNWSRGYVFVITTEPDTAAENILRLNDKYKEEEGFIIRADTMKEPFLYSLVITINANSEERFNEIANQIKDISGDQDAITALVANYNPYPPHKAKGVITEQEANPVVFGIQDRNVWG